MRSDTRRLPTKRLKVVAVTEKRQTNEEDEEEEGGPRETIQDG